MIDTFGGLRIVEDRHLCRMAFVRWRRPHRQKRIAKKWAKRYGAVIECRAENACRIGSMLLVCPHMAEKIRKEIQRG